MSEPRTEAGKRLLAQLVTWDEEWDGSEDPYPTLEDAILAIEAEASGVAASEPDAEVGTADEPYMNAYTLGPWPTPTAGSGSREASGVAASDGLLRVREAMRAIDDRLDALTEGCEPGPWHGFESGDRGAHGWWLDNPAGDSSFPDVDDMAAMLNTLLAIRSLLAADTTPEEER